MKFSLAYHVTKYRPGSAHITEDPDPGLHQAPFEIQSFRLKSKIDQIYQIFRHAIIIANLEKLKTETKLFFTVKNSLVFLF